MFLIGVALSMAWLLQLSWEKASSVIRVQLATSLTPPETLRSSPQVINILMVGSDSAAGLDRDRSVLNGRRGERNGDVIIIAHLDERDGSAALLSFPRDLWVEMAATGQEAKINKAFATGGPAELIDTIEENFDVPINYFVNIDFAGFEGLVEAVGSVEVYFPEPARDWNPETRATQTGFEMLEAGCRALDPPTALAYVRSRYYQTMVDGRWRTDPTSDLGRIRRQQEFLQRLGARAIELGARNPFVLSDLIDAGLKNVSIDQQFTPQLLIDLGRTYGSFEPGELATYTFPTRSGSVGAANAELPLTDQAEPLLAYFRGASADDPSTVGLELVHARSEAESTESLAASLSRRGFEPTTKSGSNLAPGVSVFHGPDGAAAASVVAAALQEELGFPPAVRLLPADARVPLVARNIRVTVGAFELVVPEFPLVDDLSVDDPVEIETTVAGAEDVATPAPSADGCE
ncbi:MAG: LCP family protein [Actinomycetota bacterium]|nr:LCP family protein [Actinomycetota bacterium]